MLLHNDYFVIDLFSAPPHHEETESADDEDEDEIAWDTPTKDLSPTSMAKAQAIDENFRITMLERQAECELYQRFERLNVYPPPIDMADDDADEQIEWRDLIHEETANDG